MGRTVATPLLAVILLLVQSQLAFAADADRPSKVSEELRKLFDGAASFYADKFHGRRTASGARLDTNAMTCAHRNLPFGTKLLVENPRTGKTCVVTVNDRGPFCGKRVIDLSHAAARCLGITGVGHVVCYTGKTLTKSAVALNKIRSAVISLEVPKAEEPEVQVVPFDQPGVFMEPGDVAIIANGTDNVSAADARAIHKISKKHDALIEVPILEYPGEVPPSGSTNATSL